MARYLYTGPDGSRPPHVPTWGFDDGVITEDEVRALTARGHLRDLRTAAPEPVEPVEAERAEAPEAVPGKPLNRMNKAELAALAESLGLPADGTNAEIAARIAGAR